MTPEPSAGKPARERPAAKPAAAKKDGTRRDQADADSAGSPSTQVRVKAATEALIDESLSNADIMKKNGYPYVVHPLMDGVPRCDPALLRAWVDWAKAQAVVKEATLIVAPEAMALPLAG